MFVTFWFSESPEPAPNASPLKHAVKNYQGLMSYILQFSVKQLMVKSAIPQLYTLMRGNHAGSLTMKETLQTLLVPFLQTFTLLTFA